MKKLLYVLFAADNYQQVFGFEAVLQSRPFLNLGYMHSAGFRSEYNARFANTICLALKTNQETSANFDGNDYKCNKFMYFLSSNLENRVA
jgi:hypothetical protein